MNFPFLSTPKINEEAVYYKHGKQHNISVKKINPVALWAVRSLRQNNYEAYIVGGCLRDLLLGNQPKDFDVATNARPEQIRKILSGAIIIGKRFKLVHLRRGRNVIEISTFRSAGKHFLRNIWSFLTSRGGKRYFRQNIYGTMAEDVQRRDITVNALYYDPDTQCIIDYVRAMDDIQSKTARIIGDSRKRFKEDPMRMIRILRFAAKLKLRLAEDIKPAIEELHPRINTLPQARLFDEFVKLFFTGQGLSSYKILQEFGLLHYFFSDFESQPSPDKEEILRHALVASDTRIRKNTHWTPVFLLSLFLWFVYKPLLDRPIVSKNRNRRKKRSEDALFFERHLRACQEVFSQQRETMLIFIRHRRRIEKIWAMQRTLLQYNQTDPDSIKRNNNFRIAYDLLKALSIGYKEMRPAVEWWEPFILKAQSAARRRDAAKSLPPNRQKKAMNPAQREETHNRSPDNNRSI